MKSTEKNTQKAILDYLAARNIFHYRNNSGAMVGTYKGRNRFFKFGATGSPDIVAVWKGQYIGIEVKDIKGKLNENQVRFRDNLLAAGGLYILARSVDDVISFFD